MGKRTSGHIPHVTLGVSRADHTSSHPCACYDHMKQPMVLNKMLVIAICVYILAGGISEATKTGDSDTVKDTQPNCPDGWQYGSAFKSCYYISRTPLNWPDAQLYCQNIGGNLASINTSDEYGFLLRLANAANPMYLTWIGLRANNNISPFLWFDGTPLNYVKWLQGEPTDFGGLCVGWRTDNTDGWRNIACESQQQFICKQSSEHCPNGILSGSSGSVSSSNYPNNYANDLNCTYQITVPVGLRVNLTFDDFNTEAKYDYVYLYDGPNAQSPLIENLTGLYPKGWNDSVQTTGNQMTLLFHTDASGVRSGWHGNWAAISLNESFCPGGQLSGYTGTLASPHYPNNYDSNLECLYRITASSTLARIRLTFDAFNTEFCCDRLTLFDGPTIRSRQIARLSGTLPPGTSYSTNGYVLTMLFHTDSSIQMSGFHGSWISFG